jgi:hypothetical protein
MLLAVRDGGHPASGMGIAVGSCHRNVGSEALFAVGPADGEVEDPLLDGSGMRLAIPVGEAAGWDGHPTVTS